MFILNTQVFDKDMFPARLVHLPSTSTRVVASGLLPNLSYNSLSNASNSAHASTMAQVSTHKTQLFLLGPFALRDGTGTVFTPRGTKAKALLALLALAPRKQRTRVWLRDKLWSASDERRSSTSLRQVLFELRRDLGWLFDALLDIDRHAIGLRPDAVWIDHAAVLEGSVGLADLGISQDTELLEGMDVKDEEFEDWLLLERQSWAQKADSLSQDPAQAGPPAPPPDTRLRAAVMPQTAPRLSIGILPSIQQGFDVATSHIADLVLEGIVKNLSELHRLDLFDFRDARDPSDSLIAATDTDYFVRIRVLQIRQTLTLTFFFYQAEKMSLEWSQSIQTTVDEVLDLDSYVTSGFITQNVDRMSRSISSNPRLVAQDDASPNVAGYTALNMMFRLDRPALENAETLLAQTGDGSSEALFLALRTYAASFKLGENLGVLDMAGETETAKLARQALDRNPFNAISLACLGHTMGYVFRDHSLAGEVLERALELNPNQAFVWDHYALHNLYIGDYDRAQRAAKRAVYLGSYSPISYSYDTTLAMTATMLGQRNEAIQSSRNALRKQPRFAAALRCLLVNLTDGDQVNQAQGVYDDLLRIDPEFKDPETQKARFRVADKSKETALLETIRKFT